ncbi:hypothetical protein [Streptomyces sp. NPDC060054]|uniref:hypothetical protein n=1 Tax=Streptomyces sp. NPDC060054 TaxID=3347048 RepID=UPI0026D023C8
MQSDPLPFLLSARQGAAARTLLEYVGSLPLTGADAQLLAMVIAIRAARGGVGNLTGADLRSLRLGDAEAALGAVTALGWQPQGDLLHGDPDTPVGVVVPDLADDTDRRLPFGKNMRSRVSGWTTRALAAKPVKKTSPATRLAALYLAAHSTSDRCGALPAGLPAHCHAALPELLAKGFVSELDGDSYLLSPVVRHLSGQYPRPGDEEREEREQQPKPQPDEHGLVPAERLRWEEWKARASTALRRHIDNVQRCPLCSIPEWRVAEAFIGKPIPAQRKTHARAAYTAWKENNPDRGPRTAEFAAAFRAEHGHGPSIRQLCEGMGWGKQRRALRTHIVERLIANEWLTNTQPVPWTLRPGKAFLDGTSNPAAADTAQGQAT